MGIPPVEICLPLPPLKISNSNYSNYSNYKREGIGCSNSSRSPFSFQNDMSGSAMFFVVVVVYFSFIYLEAPTELAGSSQDRKVSITINSIFSLINIICHKNNRKKKI